MTKYNIGVLIILVYNSNIISMCVYTVLKDYLNCLTKKMNIFRNIKICIYVFFLLFLVKLKYHISSKINLISILDIMIFIYK